MLVMAGREANPRRLCLTDMKAYLQELMQDGISIFLAVDANESTKITNSGVHSLAITCGLVDVHEQLQTKPAASHQLGSQQIDYMFALIDIMTCISQGEILDLHQG